jgi:hypothetical protein
MSSWLRVLEATTLVNCDINQHCPRLHFFDQRIGDKLWSLCSGNQNRTNYQIGILDSSFNFEAVACDGSKSSGV